MSTEADAPMNVPASAPVDESHSSAAAGEVAPVAAAAAAADEPTLKSEEPTTTNTAGETATETAPDTDKTQKAETNTELAPPPAVPVEVKSEAEVKEEPMVLEESAAVEPAAAPAAPSATKLPSDTAIRTLLRSLLAECDLHTLTPKLVRGRIAASLSVTSDDLIESLRLKLKVMLPEELAKFSGSNKKASASTAAAPTSGSKKRKEASDEEAEKPSKKKAKSTGGRSSKYVDADIDRLAAEADEVEDEPELTQEEADAAYAASLAESFGRPRRAAAPVSKPRKPAVRKPVDPDAPKKLASISPALSAFFGNGVSEMNRGDVVKQLWVYIKAHSLQDPSNGRKILLDDKLKHVFGENRRTMDMFQMNKLLQPHLKNKHQLADS